MFEGAHSYRCVLSLVAAASPLCASDPASQAAIAALSQTVQQLQLKQQEEHRQLQLEHQQQRLVQQEEHRQMLLMQAQIHRLEHTVTTAGDVGARVLVGAVVDATASFLPALETALPSSLLASLPAAVNLELHSRNMSSASAASARDAVDREEKDAADTVSDVMPSRKNPEQPIQSSYTALFPHVVSQLRSSLHFHDTHLRNYLTLPTGKIDATFTASGAVLWSDVVTLAEFKPSLVRSTPAYNEAVGQVIQRCQDIFDQQPQRTFVVAMVMDAAHIDVMHVSKPTPFRLVHTGRLPFALSADSAGFLALCRLLAAPLDRLGFIAAVVPAPFELQSLRGTVSSFLPLRAVSLSHRTSAVYRASCTRWKGQDLVVKFAPSDANAAHEATVLSQLHAVATPAVPIPPSIPRVLACGPLPKPHDHFHHFLLMQPFGRHLGMGGDEPAGILCRVLADVCDAMEYAFSQLDLLHRDISYGNIVLVDHPLQGVLIDWHVASQRQAEAHNDRITGTPLFTAHQLFFPGHAHSLLDDLESLLYVLLHIASNGRLPWAHSPHKAMDAIKFWHLAKEAPFDELLSRCTEALRPLIRQLRSLLFAGEVAVTPASASVSLPATPSAAAEFAAAGSRPASAHPDLAVLHQFQAAFRAAVH
jgi:hypothetical protein